MPRTVWPLLALALLAAPVQAAPHGHKPVAAKPAAAPSPATIWYTEQFTLHSKIAGRDYLIQVSKPFLKPGEKAPVIYVLDGDLDFGIAEGVMGPDGAVGSMQPAYIVAIGYGVDKAKWLKMRNDDLLFVPASTSGPATGGHGDTFLRFLREELRPLIETRYAVDPHKAILAGQSYGGLFTAHVLLNTPDAFDGYVVGSPAVWAEPALLDKAASFRAPVKVPVFIGVGTEEEAEFGGPFHMVSGTQALAAKLGDHDANIDMKLWLVPEENHFTVTAPLFERGFRFVLPAPAPTSGSD